LHNEHNTYIGSMAEEKKEDERKDEEKKNEK
jgi:hypothetical protein